MTITKWWIVIQKAWRIYCPPPNWRVIKYDDGLWYAEVDHIDQGWVYNGKGHKSMVDAAAEGRKLYERKELKC